MFQIIDCLSAWITRYLVKRVIQISIIRGVFKKWGEILLREGGKVLTTPDDVVTEYLGYWTDNGAYYYYNTVQGMNYENTIVEISEYFKQQNIPVKYINYDSWWYQKGKLPR